jgi:hypothetical protein
VFVPRFVTIGYGDREGTTGLTPQFAMRPQSGRGAVWDASGARHLLGDVPTYVVNG